MSELNRKKRKTCFICGNLYRSGSCEKGNKKFHCFQVPKHKLEEWKHRVCGLKASSLLCHIHFEDKYINKGKTIQGVFYPHMIWRLTDNAIPHLFTGKDSSRTKGSPLKQLFSTGVQQRSKTAIKNVNFKRKHSGAFIDVYRNQNNDVTLSSMVKTNAVTFKKSVESLNIDTENDTSTSTQQITIYTSMEYPVKLEPDSFEQTVKNANSHSSYVVEDSLTVTSSPTVAELNTNCIECKRELKGKCSLCLIKELKSKIADENLKRVAAERQNVTNKRLLELQKKKIERLRKEINTLRKRIGQMSDDTISNRNDTVPTV